MRTRPQNRTGPACGFCKPGFSMNAEGCSAEPCPPEEELRKLEIAAMVIFGVVAVLAWFALVARPVCPEFDWLMARMMQVREGFGAEGRPLEESCGWPRAVSATGSAGSCLYPYPAPMD